MPSTSESTFEARALDDLAIEDESSFAHVALYSELKSVLRRSSYRFRVLPPGSSGRWEQAQLINLSFWDSAAGGDVLAEPSVPADVVAHVAWHHLAHRELAAGDGATASALFLGESIASAFDLYLVGCLLGRAPDSAFLETQVPAMADAAQAAGCSAEEFEGLLSSVADSPAAAFAELRELLFDATSALFRAGSPEEALEALQSLEPHRFSSLLHHYELSNWVLYARAYARASVNTDARVKTVERGLREAPVALDWLAGQWIEPLRNPDGRRSLLPPVECGPD